MLIIIGIILVVALIYAVYEILMGFFLLIFFTIAGAIMLIKSILSIRNSHQASNYSSKSIPDKLSYTFKHNRRDVIYAIIGILLMCPLIISGIMSAYTSISNNIKTPTPEPTEVVQKNQNTGFYTAMEILD